MDHDYIDRFDLVDRYLMGKLTTDESAKFEEHFVDCPQCIDRLKTAKHFLMDLRRETVQQASETENRLRRGAPVFFSQIISRKSLAMAAGFLLLVTLSGSIFLFNQARNLRFEVAEAKRASAEWERRYEEERQALSSLEKKREDAERELTERIRQFEEDIKTHQKLRAELASADRRIEPQINPLMLNLQAVRGTSQNSSESTNEITLARDSVPVIVSVPLEGLVNYKDYYVTILDDDGRTVWRKNGLRPTELGVLLAVVSSSFFRPGKYTLKAEGIDEKGSRTLIGNYHFRIIKKS